MSTSPHTCAHCLSTPPSAAKGPPAQPVPARRGHARGLPQPPRLPSCAQNFLPNNHPSAVRRQKLFFPNRPVLVHENRSRELSSISRTRAHACATPPSAAEGPPARPCARPTTRAPFASQPSAVLRPKFLAQSHTFSRHLSCNAPASRLPVNPFNRPKMLLTSIPFETGTLPANATTVSWPSRLPLRNTKYAIQRPTCSFPLARAWTTV